MNEALKEAKKSFDCENVPVGAVLVYDDAIISRSSNESSNAMRHAEISCIEYGCEFLQKRYLDECEIFVTLEPCEMCYNAIILSRISRVFFGAFAFKDLDSSRREKKIEYCGGFLQNECSLILKEFFQKKRRSDLVN